MQLEPAWRDLYRCECPIRAGAVATCIASMEYDVRLLRADGREVEADSPADAETYLIRVTDSDWAQIAAVLDEIIAEQQDFDDLLTWREHRYGTGQRRMLLAMVIILATLAAGGLIEL